MVLLLGVMSPTMVSQTSTAAPVATASQTQITPEVRIPVVPLGYLPPGDLPAFYYYAMVELHFIDADHLMFVFNTPGLLERDDNCPDSDVQRMVQAVVFQLPSGKVVKQTHWELYDFMDFLWGLGDGELLLRRCNQLDTVGADLNPRLLIQAGGKVEDVSFSPDHSLVIVQEKAKASAENTDSGALPSVLAQQPATPRTNVSFIQLHPLQIIGRAELPLPSAIPVIANAFFEVLTAPHDQWVVNMQVFRGSQRQIAAIHSLCPPAIQAISSNMLVAETCSKEDRKTFEGYDLQGSLLWEIPLAPDQYDPQLIPISNGSRFAIVSLRLKHPHAALDPLTKEDVDGENIDIYDTHSGIRIATFQTTPAYTGGRNVDFSPDGQRMAVLHDGAIEIYSLNDLVKALPAMAR